MSVLKRYNGTNWETVGPAISSQELNDVKNSFNDLSSSFNIITMDQFEVGGLYQATGLPYSGSNFRSKDFIPFDDIYVVFDKLTSVLDEPGNLQIFCYDENKEFIGRYDLYRNIGIHKVYGCEGCRYIKIMVNSFSKDIRHFDGMHIYIKNSNFLTWLKYQEIYSTLGNKKIFWQHKFINHTSSATTEEGKMRDGEYRNCLCSYDIPVNQYTVLFFNGIDELFETGLFASVCLFFYNSGNYISKRWVRYIDGSTNVVYKYYNQLIPPNVETMRIEIYANGTVPLELGDMVNFTVEDYYSELHYKEDCHGIKELELDYIDNQWASYYNMSNNHNSTSMTRLYPMPKDGLRICHTDSVLHQLKFYNKDIDGKFVPAVDYPYCYYKTSYIDSFSGRSVYYPYADNLYFTISVRKWNKDINPKEHIHLITGHIQDNGGRLPNLQPATIYISKETDDYNRDGQRLCIFGSGEWNRRNGNAPWINAFDSYTRSYCSILRLKDVNKIVVNPQYHAVARIYKINNDDKTAEIVDEIFGIGEYRDSYYQQIQENITHQIGGVNIIDFSKYNFEGFIVLGIQHSFEEAQSEPSTLTAKAPSHGILRDYEEVYNSVFVEWKAGVNVTYDGSMPAIARKNIDTIMHNTFISSYPNKLYSDSGYGNWSNSNTKRPFPTIPEERVTGWWYNGSNHCNVPYMHITPKSYITASKNPHSRVYVPQLGGTGSMNNLYGSVCSSTSSLVCGFPCGNETFTYCSREMPYVDYRDFENIESFQAGDIFASGKFLPNDDDPTSSSYGHVLYITEIVRINGEVFCVNAFENGQPMLRFRTFTNMSAYKDYQTIKVPNFENEVNIFTFFSLEGYMVDRPYAILARPKSKYYKTFRDAYNSKYEVQDYPITSIMCDRGTDSVYCIGEYMSLTVTDGTTTITLQNETSTRVIDLTTYESTTYDNDVVYNVTGMITEPGYYQIKVNNQVMESFFVPQKRYIYGELDTINHTCTTYFDPSEEEDEVIAIGLYYQQPALDSKDRPNFYWDIDTTTVIQNSADPHNGMCTFVNRDEIKFCDEITRPVHLAKIIRRTSYGTYCIQYSFTTQKHQQQAGANGVLIQ